MSNQTDCEDAIARYYRGTSQDKGTLRSAYSDAAHLCDAIAKDIFEANMKKAGKPRKEIRDIVNQIMLVGNAIFALCDKLNEIEDQ